MAELEARGQQHEALEAQLRSEADLARLYFDLAGVMLVMIDANQGVRLINDKGCQVLGYRREEIVGKNWFDHFIPAAPRDSVRETFRRLMEGELEPAEYFENPVLTRGGEERIIAWHNTVIRDREGRIAATLSSGEDITERRRAEEAQRKSEAAERALLEAASEGIVVTGRDGRILRVNRTTEEMFGYRREELYGQSVEILLPERLREIHMAHRALYFDAPRVRPMGRGFDLAGRRRDGSEFPVEVSLSYVEADEGLVAMAFITDITERKQAERRLQAQFAVTEALAGSAELKDAIPRVLRAICECLGWDLGEFWQVDPVANVLRWAGGWYPPTLDAVEFEALSREVTFSPGVGLIGGVWARGEPLWMTDVPQDPRHFPRVAVATRIGLRAAFGFPILNGEGLIGIMVFFSREIRLPDEPLLKMMADVGRRIGQHVEHRRAQEELQRQREALLQSEKLAAVGTLSAGLTHEINNPLGIVTARIDVMLEEAGAHGFPPEFREDLIVIRRNAQRVARIAQRLLSFARQTPGERVALDLNQVVEETLLLVEKQAQQEGIAIVRELGPSLPPVRGNSNELQQVVLNLVNNAREAMRHGGSIVIATEPLAGPKPGVRLHVRDTGAGIPAEHLAKVFDPFFTTKPGGTGLGLSVTYGIVREHGGLLDVETEAGKGAHFTVTLPAMTGSEGKR